MNDRVDTQTPPTLQLDAVTRLYRQNGRSLIIFDAATLTLNRGEAIALVGPSGAGKSSLLHIAGLLDPPDRGQVILCGHPCDNLGDAARSRLRKEKIGFIYQHHYLINEFTALDNVALQLMLLGINRRRARSQAEQLLTTLGLGARLNHRPAALSGGERQRVAIARALIGRPDLILADEPTGSLDSITAADVFTILLEIVHRYGLAVLIATHNEKLAAQADRQIILDRGILHPATINSEAVATHSVIA